MFNKLLTFIKEVHIITNDSKRYDLYISNKNARKEQHVSHVKTRMAEISKNPWMIIILIRRSLRFLQFIHLYSLVLCGIHTEMQINYQ